MKPAQKRKLIAARRLGLAADTRLDWRDPHMPCLEGRTLVDNWTGKIVERKMVEISAEQSQFNAQNRLMQSEFQPQHSPSWRSDPTYNMRRKT